MGISGGPDSMALLFVLNSLREDYGLQLIACYVDHKLRRESREEAIFVSRVSRDLDIPFVLKEIDIGTIKKGKTLEEAARICRYRALEEARRENYGDKIAVGHHLDDQVETVLMRIVRGTSLKGLKGIPIQNGVIIRPLRNVWREEILDFCKNNNIPYLVDRSNLSLVFTRNKVRLELIPSLSEYNPKVKDAIFRLSSQAEELDVFLDNIGEEFIRRCTKSPYGVFIPLSLLESTPSTLRRRMVMRLLNELSPKPYMINIQSYNMVLELIDKSTGKSFNLPGGSIAYRDADGIRIIRTIPFLNEYKLSVPGTTFIYEISKRFIIDTIPKEKLPTKFTDSPYTFYIDFDKIEMPIFLRAPKEGDRFYPLGLDSKSKKLQDIMVDRKVPKEYRGIYPVIADSKGDIICLPEYTISEKVKITEDTRRVLIIRIEEYRR
ncbi:MAG: tRNA lysidine(34) synthetase TilS [bacterium]